MWSYCREELTHSRKAPLTPQRMREGLRLDQLNLPLSSLASDTSMNLKKRKCKALSQGWDSPMDRTGWRLTQFAENALGILVGSSWNRNLWCPCRRKGQLHSAVHMGLSWVKDDPRLAPQQFVARFLPSELK